jgi:phenylalanyl-tRNA synthetase alpha chain
MDLFNEKSNVPQSIKAKIGMNLHNKQNHPIQIVKENIYKYFRQLKTHKFEMFDDLPPYVTVENNFDKLLIPKNHPARQPTDTFYVNETTVLRTHTSAHQNELLEKGHRSFLVTGDVYRKDEIDKSHYPVFTQMEGLHIVEDGEDAEAQLKKILSGLVEHLFPNCEYRFNDDYFPFTTPSFEIEVKFNDKWLEILGCGVVHRDILDKLNIKQNAWAFGIGQDRCAMILFGIPDIRLFWTTDNRFHDQFKDNNNKFVPYPILTPIAKDISFWLDNADVQNTSENKFTWNKINDFYELVREICGDTIESVALFDERYHDKKNLYSHAYRLTFSPNLEMDNPSELNKTANDFMKQIRESVPKLQIKLR